ncbi:hypothetical protein ABEF95_003502 [Exophiala dermatitidis]
MLPAVRAINAISPDIAVDPACRDYSSDTALDRIDRQQRLLSTARLDPPAVSRHEHQVAGLEVAYMIQRRDDTVQNSKALVTLPPLCCFDIQCPSPCDGDRTEQTVVDELLDRLLSADLERPGATQAAPTRSEPEEHALRPRALATVPGLARVPAITSEMLTFRYIHEQGWPLNPENSFIFKFFDKLLASSAKLQRLQDIILQLGKDASGEAEKLVVVSHLPVICLCVVVLCIRLGIGWRWIHANVDPLERGELVDEFQAQGSVDGEDDTEGKGRTFRIMIGTARIMSQGMTLHKAIRLVLMEPSYSIAVEAQTCKRVHRIGSRSDRCWFYRLVNPESRLELGLLKAQAREMEFEQNVHRAHHPR